LDWSEQNHGEGRLPLGLALALEFA
jgi:hypothetical protein